MDSNHRHLRSKRRTLASELHPATHFVRYFPLPNLDCPRCVQWFICGRGHPSRCGSDVLRRQETHRLRFFAPTPYLILRRPNLFSDIVHLLLAQHVHVGSPSDIYNTPLHNTYYNGYHRYRKNTLSYYMVDLLGKVLDCQTRAQLEMVQF